MYLCLVDEFGLWFCTHRPLFNPFPNDKFWTPPIRKSWQMTISDLTKMEESSSNGWKTLWEKETLLVKSVFKRLVLQTRLVWERACLGKG